MFFKSLSSICISFVFLASAAYAQAEPTQNVRNSRATALFEEFARDFPAINAVAIVDGETVWEASGGVLSDDRDGPDRDYNAYSVAKMLTGMAYARLVYEHDLSIDTPVTEIDPDLPAHYKPVKLKHLLSHLGGVRHYTSEEDWIAFAKRRCETPADALGHFIDDPLIAAPAEKHQYTTFGFTLLSHLLTIITQTNTYDDAMRSALGEHYYATTDHDGADKAVNFGKSEDGDFSPLDNINAQCKYGGGGILASARGLARTAAALYAGDIIPLDDIPDAFAPVKTKDGEVTGHAFGMNAGKTRTIQPSIYYAAHSGGSPGGRAYMVSLIEPKVAVALTANFDGPGMSEIAFDLAKLFAGIEPAKKED
ncbi:serine hydrolase [Hyphococcus flavus]|uniref:Serine hydrolase n=1 Tax=Hyphococcus flavus TaxID=1866326 RepID=A0AAF0CGC3_9PROT|nr:serine hydrolase domain-containing protein [Hyphococcus flavus]WDI32204.1 serine hydrolase [Hyphococcus flavus]